MKAILTVGVSASGKSTWAKGFVSENPNWVIVCRDDIRAGLLGGKLDWSKWNWRREDEVNDIQAKMFLSAKSSGQSIIVADTNLPTVKNGKVVSSNAKKLESKLRMIGFDVEYKEFDITLEDAIERDKNREASVGESVIRGQYEKWLAYKNQD